ncbi:hypothetical protein GW17_00062090, partial [Ensete ventricosum]
FLIFYLPEVEAHLRQYGDEDDDITRDDGSPLRGVVELSRVPTSASGHPETRLENFSLSKPIDSEMAGANGAARYPTRKAFGDRRAKGAARNPHER